MVRIKAGNAVMLAVTVLGVALVVIGSVRCRMNGDVMAMLGLTIIGWAIGLRYTSMTRKPTAAAYELGHAAGFREGYEKGRRIAKPVVVPISTPADASSRQHVVS